MNQVSDQSPDDTEIAAEYVLRVLPADAHRAVAVRAASDPAFAAEIRAWETRLVPLMDTVEPVQPPAQLKAGLIERLFGREEEIAQGTRAIVWQWLAAFAFAAASALAVIAFMPQPATTPPIGPRFVAELAVENGTTRMFAVYAPETGMLNISWTARETTVGRDMHLWGIVAGADPVSIGVLPAGQTASLLLPPALLADAADLVLAISDEPSGGSPTGQPTGAVIASAPVSAL